MREALIHAALSAVLCVTASAAEANEPPRTVTLEATGTEQVMPDLYHVLMKMENNSSQAAVASTGGEKQIRDFIAAVEALGIKDLTWRISNTVFTSLQAPYSQGAAYSRNLIFTLPNSVAREERDRIVAQIQDLGAKYNSHCVTCIGSG
jgi:uncharacterized protein YggE